jgi:hypothetical protein
VHITKARLKPDVEVGRNPVLRKKSMPIRDDFTQ